MPKPVAPLPVGAVLADFTEQGGAIVLQGDTRDKTPAAAPPVQQQPVQQPPVQQQPVQQPPVQPAFSEPQLRQMGWVPQDEFTGKPENYKDADAFSQKVLTNQTAMHSALASVNQRADGLEQQVGALARNQQESVVERAASEVARVNNELIEATALGDETIIADVLVKQQEAVEAHAHAKTQSAPLQAGTDNGHWASDNAKASQLASNWATTSPWASGSPARIAKAKELSAFMNPADFQTPGEFFAKLESEADLALGVVTQPAPAPVNVPPPGLTPTPERGGSLNTVTPSALTHDQLPTEDRAVADSFIEISVSDGMSRADATAAYMTSYNQTRT